MYPEPDVQRDRVFRHPLLSEAGVAAARGLIASGQARDAREALGLLILEDAAFENADGEGTVSEARVAEREIHGPAAAAAAAWIEVPARVHENLTPSALQKEIAADALVEVWLNFRREGADGQIDVVGETLIAMLEGRVRSEADADAVRVDTWRRRSAFGAATLAEAEASIARLGGRFVSTNPWGSSATASLPARAVAELASLPHLFIAERSAESRTDTDCEIETSPGDGGYTIHGVELEGLVQTGQFYAGGWGGVGQKFALLESWAHIVHRRHPGFRTSSGDYRHRNCGIGILCQNWDPNSPLSDDGEGDHPTAVLSVLMGSVVNGQDPEWAAASTEARRRSGVARFATSLGLSTQPSAWSESLARVVDPVNGIHVVNMSSSTTPSQPDPLCLGASANAVDVNAVFAAGIAFVKSAGNGNNGASSDCTLGSPGAAVGAFLVADYTWADDNTTLVMDSSSSRGGTSTEGRGRRHIGLAAPERFRFPYPHYDRPVRDGDGAPVYYRSDWDGDGVVGDLDGDSPNPGNFGAVTATSAAAPVVAGVAGVFRDYFLSEHGASINDPGVLYVNLLLMGDRTRETGIPAVTGFDNLWGAGILRARTFNPAGLDGPARWASGSVCVGTGETVFVAVTPGDPASPDTDYVKAVTWSFDNEFALSTTAPTDDIALLLQRSSDGTSWTTVRTSDTTDDKEFVFVSGSTVGNNRWRLAIRGDTVVGTGFAGCPAGKQRVHYALLIEDNDRETGDVPACVRGEL